jgi:hypothetical protein
MILSGLRETGLMRDCQIWVMEVDRLMRRDWCIGVVDAGLDAEELIKFCEYGESPAEFVAWFGEKYDLIRFEPRPPKSEPSKPPASA